MFSTYFVFHCLNMFCFEKQVSEFWLLILATCVSCQQAASFGYSFWRLASRKSKLQVHREGIRDSLATQLVTH